MKLLGSTKSKISKDKNGKNVSHLEIAIVVLVYYNYVNIDYERNPSVWYTFIPDISFGQLLDISPKNFIFLKSFNSGFSYTEVWFNDQNSKPLDREDKANITLVID